jgi:hypothetical protein
MGAGEILVDEWPKQVNTVALRNQVYPRRWGMMVTVIIDATTTNNTTWVLVYNLVDTNKNNNANWQTLADYAGGGTGTTSILRTDLRSLATVNAALTTINSYSLPGNTLDEDGKSIIGRDAGNLVGSLNNKQIFFKINGTTIFDSGIFISPVNANWVLDYQIIRENAAAVQCWIRLITDIGGNSFVDRGAVVIADFSAAMVLTVEAQGVVTGDIGCNMLKITYEPPGVFTADP